MVLEPLSAEHIDGLFEAGQPPEIWEWWPFTPATDWTTFGLCKGNPKAAELAAATSAKAAVGATKAAAGGAAKR
ncbi:MAG: hypothetical protein M3071_08270 [Actinomycetota bacterium]|nr:hypothetical protein [Actinomycetota bacterium]